MLPQGLIFKWVIPVWLLVFSSMVHALKSYQEVKNEIEESRRGYGTLMSEDLSSVKRKALLVKAAEDFHLHIINDLVPSWIGTRWDFNGTSEKPGEGSIACGYFVTTILRDAHVNVRRVKLAQLPSESMIKILVTPDSIGRYSNTSVDGFLEDVTKRGQGLYVVGLDYHVGLLSVESDGIFFIHSSYQPPYAVVREAASKSTILADSKYRVVGKLDNEAFLIKWFNGEVL